VKTAYNADAWAELPRRLATRGLRCAVIVTPELHRVVAVELAEADGVLVCPMAPEAVAAFALELAQCMLEVKGGNS
jgi:hypothetical protein